jgi:hypothetical protein
MHKATVPSPLLKREDDMTTRKFEVMNLGYPLHVHAANCKDLSGPKYRGRERGWMIEGETVNEAVAEETKELNSQFDSPYTQDELFKIFPCCR